MVTLGARIREIRMERGETLEEFGKHFNTPKTTVFYWEKGRNKPNKENLKKLADLAGTTVESLLIGTCTWRINTIGLKSGYKQFQTCKHSFSSELFDAYLKDFDYCPYCGKELKID